VEHRPIPARRYLRTPVAVVPVDDSVRRISSSVEAFDSARE
jgi:hypothetical protein